MKKTNRAACSALRSTCNLFKGTLRTIRHILCASVFAPIALSLVLIHVNAVQAQNFPARTVKIVVPYPPGGFNDTLARITSDKMPKIWGQPVLVENKPGGNTTIGNNFVAKSPADGYTILISPLPFSSLPALYRDKLPYDAIKDFQFSAFNKPDGI
jgi:tripartite-type tricarboxylate transporter receptor subunit TctC